MKRILIYKEIISNGEYDILHSINYEELNNTVYNYYEGISPNWANRLWLQGIYHIISSSNNVCTFLSKDFSIDYINENFDLIVLPMANIFWIGYRKSIQNLTSVFEKIKIPTYVIACGAQADSYDEIDNLVDSLKDVASKFICAIYNTGGEFALRGYFTKEFFNRLGYTNAVVVGCPSMYQMGRNLRVNSQKVSENEFRPALNGWFDKISQYMAEYPNGVYFDQGDYFDLVFGNIDNSNIKTMIRKYGFDVVHYGMEGRIKLFPEMDTWYHYLKENSFSFSFGTRIHGNIMPVLCGIPSMVYAWDSRTREMAEFFDIPHLLNLDTRISLYELYCIADYKKFNEKFCYRYDDYIKFLCDHGIVEYEYIRSSIPFSSEDKNRRIRNDNVNAKMLKYIEDKKLFLELDMHLYRVLKKFGR